MLTEKSDLNSLTRKKMMRVTIDLASISLSEPMPIRVSELDMICPFVNITAVALQTERGYHETQCRIRQT